MNDPGYQKFVHHVIQTITTHLPPNHHGLDYGAGTGPMITKFLREKGYSITTYDPTFISNSEALKATYVFIVCCEVTEHFHNPPIRIHPFPSVTRPNWYYINDPTHTLFYSPKGMRLIREQHGFNTLELTPRLVVAKKV